MMARKFGRPIREASALASTIPCAMASDMASPGHLKHLWARFRALSVQLDESQAPLEARADCVHAITLALALLVALGRQACGIDPRSAADLTDEAMTEVAALLDRVAGILAAGGKEEAHGATL